MKFIDINREFTAAANSYMAQGYYINAGTMGGSQGEVAHIDLTNGTEIIRVLLTTFNNYLGTEGVELIVGRVKDDIKPNQEDRWNTVWNERLEVISNKKFYRLNNRAQDGFYGTEEEANAAEEKRFDRYKSRRSNDSALDVTTKAAPINAQRIEEAQQAAGVAEPVNTWAGWKAAGYMVEHGAKALFQAVLIHSSKGDGQTYRASFFGASQVKQLPSD